jgi:hypothetical protein
VRVRSGVAGVKLHGDTSFFLTYLTSHCCKAQGAKSKGQRAKSKAQSAKREEHRTRSKVLYSPNYSRVRAIERRALQSEAMKTRFKSSRFNVQLASNLEH